MLSFLYYHIALGFSKVLLVMHPFLRLAKSYKQIFESGSANKDLRVKLEKYMDPKAHTSFDVSFKFLIRLFLNFLTYITFTKHPM